MSRYVRKAPKGSAPAAEAHIPRDQQPTELELDLQKAIERERFDIARVIAELALAEQQLHGPSLRLARAYLNVLSVPRHEQLFLLANGSTVDVDLANELDGIYAKIDEPLRLFYDEIHPFYTGERRITEDRHTETHYSHIVGSVTELTIFALYNRSGAASPFIAVPSTPEEDRAGRDNQGQSHARDLHAHATTHPRRGVPVQVKTHADDETRMGYAPSVLVVGANQLTGSPDKARHALPKAIMHEIAGETTQTERNLLDLAARRLMRHTTDHLHSGQ